MPGNVHVALVHHPVRGRDGSIITTSVTNLDVHDIARTARTYDVHRYAIVTPIEAQRELVEHILGHWTTGDGARRVPTRGEALAHVEVVPTFAQVLATCGPDPLVLTTAARSGFAVTSFDAARALVRDRGPREVLIVFGTGYGLADSVIECATHHLAPVRPGVYNHLAVRSAAAIVLDRLFGDEGASSS